jgi:hypothetical protein
MSLEWEASRLELRMGSEEEATSGKPCSRVFDPRFIAGILESKRGGFP